MNAHALIDLITGPDGIAALAGLSVGVSVVLVWISMLERRPARARLNAVVRRRDALRKAVTGPKRRQRVSTGKLAGQLVGRLKLMGSATAAQAKGRLVAAGLRGPDALATYMLAKVGLPVAFGALAAALFLGLGWLGLPAMVNLLLVMVAVAIGFYAPDLHVSNAGTKRRGALLRGLPDGLDLMVICTEAGLGLDAALARVSREIAVAHPVLAEELALTGVELGLLPDRRSALNGLSHRTDLPAVQALVSTLMQAERYGTPLAQALRVLAAELRDMRLMKAEEKAARLPALLTLPLVMFIMPALFIVLIGPGILEVLDGLASMKGR